MTGQCGRWSCAIDMPAIRSRIGSTRFSIVVEDRGKGEVVIEGHLDEAGRRTSITSGSRNLRCQFNPSALNAAWRRSP
jgi:hypothetical protein